MIENTKRKKACIASYTMLFNITNSWLYRLGIFGRDCSIKQCPDKSKQDYSPTVQKRLQGKTTTITDHKSFRGGETRTD